MRSRELLLLSLLVIGVPARAAAQEPVRYEIAFPNAAHHEAEVTVTFSDVGPGPLELRMSRTSPGRYALHEFAKNVYAFRATGADGREVRIERPDLHQWTVMDHGGEVSVSYTLFGDRADGTYTGIDRTHAHLNMPATFMWARGLEARPIELRVVAPEGSGWRVATQLEPTDDPARFRAPDLQYFLDSPTEVSDHWLHTWTVEGPDGPQRMRIALHHDGTEAEERRYAEHAQAIVDASIQVYGTAPSFDHGTYTFLACYLPWVSGDGMEHRNSTVLTSTGSLARSMTGLLGTVAHEFFHAWNMERLRSAALEPFDFEAANVSDELWFGEGFTSYYDDLILWRAGVIDEDAFVERVGGIANAVVNAPGRRYRSPVEMSRLAPFVDAATSVDPTNLQNTFLSYYTWGSGIGLALDLTLRTRFAPLTLDHLMREMWRAHGSPEVPYRLADIEAALARVTADERFARDFLDRYVRGREAPDYGTLLSAAGVALSAADGDAGTLGPAQLAFDDTGATLRSGTLVGTPLYEAGLDRGDVLLELNGRAVTSRDDLNRSLASRAPGESVSVRFASRGDTLEADVVLAASDALSAATDTGRSYTEAERAFRARWRQAPEDGR